MSASDIAKEIITFTKRTDRPSPLVLIIYSRSSLSSRGPRDFRNENDTMRITAPTVRGDIVFRVSFPLTNYTAVNSSGNLSIQQSQRAVLEYNARDNLPGAASCVEGYMTYRDQRDVMLFTLEENGTDLGPFPLGRWCLEDSRSGSSDTGKISSRLTVLQQILMSLLVV
eukprot:CCRYP_011150-RA/>CCRYP_011150-RA protein AED:0.34 eAED:0.34 QI:276/1/1/1/0/0/3/337/168